MITYINIFYFIYNFSCLNVVYWMKVSIENIYSP